MEKITNIFKNDKMAYFVSILFSILLFLAIYGIQPLNILNASWLDKYDSVQRQFIDWALYRNDGWGFPIITAHTDFMAEGRIPLWNIIPMFAIVFKAISFALPDSFQYFGIWALMNIVLFAVFSVRIFRRFLDNNIKVIIASVLLILLTVFMGRMFVFTPLNAQWIVLACFILLDKSMKDELSDKKMLKIFLVLTLISSFIHLYFSLICVSFSVGIIVYRLFCKKDYRINLLLLAGSLSISIIVAVTLFTDITTLLGGEKITYIIPSISMYNTHNDLYKSYVGIGDICLVAYVVYAFISKEKFNEWFLLNWKKNIALISMAIAVAFFVIFPFEVMVTKNDNSLLTAYKNIVTSLVLSVFVSYVGLVACIIYVVNTRILKNAMWVVVIILSLQFDNVYAVLEDSFSINEGNAISFEDKIWENIAADEQIEKVAMPYRVQDAQTIYRWALENGKEIYSYRTNSLEEDNEDFLEKLENDTVLIFDKDNHSISYWKYNNLNYYLVGEYIIAYSERFEGIEQASLLELTARKFDMNNEFYFDGKVVDGVKTLFPEGKSYGPYCELPKGLYEVEIKGDNLKNNISINVYSDTTTKSYDYTFLKRKYDKVVLQVRFEEDVENLQFIIDNYSEKDVKLNYIKVTPLEFEE